MIFFPASPLPIRISLCWVCLEMSAVFLCGTDVWPASQWSTGSESY